VIAKVAQAPARVGQPLVQVVSPNTSRRLIWWRSLENRTRQPARNHVFMGRGPGRPSGHRHQRRCFALAETHHARSDQAYWPGRSPSRARSLTAPVRPEQAGSGWRCRRVEQGTPSGRSLGSKGGIGGPHGAVAPLAHEGQVVVRRSKDTGACSNSASKGAWSSCQLHPRRKPSGGDCQEGLTVTAHQAASAVRVRKRRGPRQLGLSVQAFAMVQHRGRLVAGLALGADGDQVAAKRLLDKEGTGS